MKKEYIQPEAKEIKLNLQATILAGSIVNPNTKYSMGDDDPVETEDPIDAGEGL